MSTGSKVESWPYLYTKKGTPLLQQRVRNWSGVNAITSAKPRSSFPRRKLGPKGKRLSHIQLPPGDYYATIDLVKQVCANVLYDGTQSERVVTPTSSSVPYWEDPTHELKLIGKLREQAYGSGFNPAVFLAESKQCFTMIAKAAKRLGRAIDGLRRRDVHQVTGALGIKAKKGLIKSFGDRKRSLSSLWLEVSYGWLPLFKDAEESAQWLAEMLTGKPKAALRKRKSWNGGSFTLSRVPDTVSFLRADVTYDLQYVIYVHSLSPAIGLPSLQTVATVAWEKLPYSFVFDWFIPIGSYLDACRTSHDINGVVVRSLKRTTTYTEPTFHDTFGAKLLNFSGSASRQAVAFSRSVTSEIKPPNPFGNLDDVLNYHSWRHAANAVALLLQRKRR